MVVVVTHSWDGITRSRSRGRKIYGAVNFIYNM